MQSGRTTQQVLHKPIYVHIRSEDTTPVPRNTKWTGAIAILLSNNGVFFEYLEQPIKLLINITNTIPGVTWIGRTINEFYSITGTTINLNKVCFKKK